MLTAIARDGDLVIRPMRDELDDYRRMVRWRNQPHVREWWDFDEPDLTLEAALSEYGPDVRGDGATTACVIELGSRPIGYLQFYAWAAYSAEAGPEYDVPDAWGLDLFIGEPDLVGRGIGSAAVDLVCRYLFDERGASSVMLAAAVENAVALRAYEKAGFKRTRRILDTDTKGGQRIECWLMVRER